MSDTRLFWGGDLSWSPTGDLALSDGPELTQQRVLRRLLTSPGDYLWQLSYGAGLPLFVGQPGAAGAISGAILAQLAKESAIAQSPAPTIDLTPDPSGSIYVQVRYADNLTGRSSVVDFTT